MDRAGFANLARGAGRAAAGAVAALGLGLGTAAGVALALDSVAWRAPAESGTVFRDRSRFDGEGLGRLAVSWSSRPGAVTYRAVVYPTCVSVESTDARAPEDAVPKWARAAVLPWSAGRRAWPGSTELAAPGGSTESTQVRASGWPIPALWRRMPESGGGTLAPAGALTDITAWRPVWAGLAADGAIFAMGWWWLMLLPRITVWAARVARARCGHCGYDLAGLPAAAGRVRCPECGNARRAPRVPAPALRTAH